MERQAPIHDEHIVQTANALTLLRRMEVEPALSARWEQTDLVGRLRIAADEGLPFSEDELRRTIRGWDFYGKWIHRLKIVPPSKAPGSLPELSAAYALTDKHIGDYRRDGHIVLPGVASVEEMSSYLPAIRATVDAHNTQADSPTEGAEDRAYLQVLNLRVRDETARQLVLARRFAHIAARLLGVSAVRVYLDQCFFKEPGGKITHWHQDLFYFPLATDHVTTMWIPLVPTSADMGLMSFASGSHREGAMGKKPERNEAEGDFPEFVAKRGYRPSEEVERAVGDASFHHGWVLHAALPNRSDRAREALGIVYYPDGVRIAEPDNVYRRRAMELLFKGRNPGDLAVSSINPVAYAAES